MKRLEITEAELHAFVDGELDALRSRAVGGAIAADPSLRARVEGYRSDREALSRIYGPLIEEPLPPRLVQAVVSRPAPRPAAWVWAGASTLAAAAAIVLVLWLGIGGPPEDALLAEANAVRDGGVAVTRQVAATAPAEERDALLTDALGTKVPLPDLGQEGYSLASLAAYPDRAHGKAIQVNYRNGQGRLFTLYLHRPTGADRYEVLPEPGGKHVCIWESQELSAVMIGEMSEHEMYEAAALAYRTLNL